MDISGYFAPQSSKDARLHPPAKKSGHPQERTVRPAAPHEGWPVL